MKSLKKLFLVILIGIILVAIIVGFYEIYKTLIVKVN